jgi:hypothetical protein
MGGPCFAPDDPSQVACAWVFVGLCTFMSWGGVHLIRYSGKEAPISKAEGPVRPRSGLGILIVALLFARYLLACLFFGKL